MPRKRKTDQEPTTEPSTTVAEPPVIEPPASEIPVAQFAPTETPVVQPPAIEPPTPDPNVNGQKFADKVGQKKWTPAPDPFGIAKDNLAGVRLFESRQDQQMAIKFGEGRPEDKPSQAVIDKMKEAGYRWNPSNRIWTHPVRADSAMGTRIDAEKLYQEVRQMIRQEKGIEGTQEIPL